jgi:hypothetical protein
MIQIIGSVGWISRTRTLLRIFDVSLVIKRFVSDSRILISASQLLKDIGRWVFEQGFSGIRYTSRHGMDLKCWAIFEQATHAIVCRNINHIQRDDPDLLRVATAWGLAIP